MSERRSSEVPAVTAVLVRARGMAARLACCLSVDRGRVVVCWGTKDQFKVQGQPSVC